MKSIERAGDAVLCLININDLHPSIRNTQQSFRREIANI